VNVDQRDSMAGWRRRAPEAREDNVADQLRDAFGACAGNRGFEWHAAHAPRGVAGGCSNRSSHKQHTSRAQQNMIPNDHGVLTLDSPLIMAGFPPYFSAVGPESEPSVEPVTRLVPCALPESVPPVTTW